MNLLTTTINSRFVNKHSTRIAWFLALLIFAIVVLSIIWTTWSQKKIKASNYQPQTINIISKNTQPAYRVNDIVSANLFGNPAPTVVKQTIAPKTTLDLTLVGVLWSSDNNLGRAIIMAGKKASELYSLGEDIKGASASIEEIRSTEVILNRNGALESLPLLEKQTNGNRPILTFENDIESDEAILSNIRSNTDNRAANPQATVISSNQTENTAPTNNRRVRQPNFPGLDRALEKMNDL